MSQASVGGGSVGAARFVSDIVTKDALDSLVAFRRFAHRSTELKGSSGEDLSVRIEVFGVLEESGKEPICFVIVVPGSENVNDCPGEFVEAGGANPGRFNSIQSSRIDFGEDRVGFDLGNSWALPEPFELLNGFLKSLLEGVTP